jgi:hypothetical protein
MHRHFCLALLSFIHTGLSASVRCGSKQSRTFANLKSLGSKKTPQNGGTRCWATGRLPGRAGYARFVSWFFCLLSPRQIVFFETELIKVMMQVFSYNEKSQLRCAQTFSLPRTHTHTQKPEVITQTFFFEKQGYDLELMKNIRLIDAWPDGRVVWELDITPFYANLNGVYRSNNKEPQRPCHRAKQLNDESRCHARRCGRSDIRFV